MQGGAEGAFTQEVISDLCQTLKCKWDFADEEARKVLVQPEEVCAKANTGKAILPCSKEENVHRLP
jgi:hypothetical protein